MPETPDAPKAIKTGDELAKALCEAMERDDTAAVRAIVLDRLRRAEGFARRAPEARRTLADAIASLGKSKDLETLVRDLDQADHAAFKRFVRDHPNVYVRRVRTADHLRTLLAEHGTAAARAAFSRALREVDAPAGSEVARFLGEALSRADDGAVADTVDRFVRRFEGAPEADEVRSLRKHLDELLQGLKRGGKLDDLARALERSAQEATRRQDGLAPYSLADQLADLCAAMGATESRAAWAAARGKPAPTGAAIAKEAVKLLAAGKAQEALDLVEEELLDPTDDRVGAAGRPAESIARWNEAVAVLSKESRLAELAKAARAADTAFKATNPHAIYAGLEHRLQSAVDRVGTEETKAAWARALRD